MLIGLLRFRNVVSIVIFFMIMESIIALCILIGNEESIFNYENRVVESEVIDFSRYSASLPSGTNCRIVIKEVVWNIPIVEKEMIKLNDRYVQPVYSSQEPKNMHYYGAIDESGNSGIVLVYEGMNLDRFVDLMENGFCDEPIKGTIVPAPDNIVVEPVMLSENYSQIQNGG